VLAAELFKKFNVLGTNPKITNGFFVLIADPRWLPPRPWLQHRIIWKYENNIIRLSDLDVDHPGCLIDKIK
jgi:hypothetical protein